MFFPAQILTLFIAVAIALAPASGGPGPPPLAVSATAIDNDVTAALDLRDIEHYIVAELIHHRVENVMPSSSLEDYKTEPTPESYLLVFSIDEAERATRPRWNWSEKRYVDDSILHLELSITLTRTKDGEVVGGLNDIREYRADDYGAFSTPQAVRGATYKAARDLVDDFVRAASGGEFGDELAAIKRPDTPADLVKDWNDLPSDWKTATAALFLFAFILALGISIRIVYALAQLTYCILVPRSMRTPAPQPYSRLQPALASPPPRRESAPTLDLDAEPDDTDEGEEEEEQTSRE